MIGTERIISHIESEAENKSAAILAAAKVKCEEIAASYAEKAEAAYREKKAQSTRECESAEESAERLARMEAKKDVLAIKQEMVGKVFEKAKEKLSNLPEGEYVQLLAKLMAGSAEGTEEVVFNSGDRALASKVVEAANSALGSAGKESGLHVSDETGSFAGGFVLKRAGVAVNCTVETLIDMLKQDMSPKVAAVLFKSGVE